MPASVEAQSELLNDALSSGHAPYIAQALGVIARTRGMTDVTRGLPAKRCINP